MISLIVLRSYSLILLYSFVNLDKEYIFSILTLHNTFLGKIYNEQSLNLLQGKSHLNLVFDVVKVIIFPAIVILVFWKFYWFFVLRQRHYSFLKIVLIQIINIY